MVAFGMGELTGLLSGLSLGTTIVHLILIFSPLIFAIILLYGIRFWGEFFSSQDAFRSFVDFMKPAVWFFYVVFAAGMFFTSYNGKVDFIPALIDLSFFEKGIVVNTPDGEQEIVKADKPYQTIYFKAPALFSLLDTADALEYLLVYYISYDLDDTKWVGWLGNDPTPQRVFAKCAREALTSVNPTDAKGFLCQDVGINLLLVKWIPDEEEKKLCMGDLGNPDAVDKKFDACIRSFQSSYESYISQQEEKVQEDYAAGKIDKATEERELNQLEQLKEKVSQITEDMQKNSDAYWKAYLKQFLEQNKDLVFYAVKEDTSTFKRSITQAVRNLINAFSETVANAFVGETTMLNYYENFIKFMLTLEVGVMFPIFFLLSCLPKANGIVNAKVEYLFYGLATYFLLKLSRPAIFLVYFAAHNFFLSKV